MDAKYSGLPEEARVVNEAIYCEVPAEQKTSSVFTESFLKRYCPRLARHDTESALLEVAHHTGDLGTRVSRKNKQQQPPPPRYGAPAPVVPARKGNKKKLLSHKDRRKFKVFDIEKDKQRYALFEPLHDLWLNYMEDVLDFSQDLLAANQRSTELKLLRADYHGCIMKVVTAKCSTLLHLEGILLMETKNAWKIITKRDSIKMIPKKNTVVSIRIKDYVFKINGSNFLCRTGERSSRPFKKFLNFK